MNDRIIVRILKKTYPLVYGKIAPEPVVKDLKKLPEYYELYIRITGIPKQDIIDNTKEQRILFIAVVAMLMDPIFFETDHKTKYGFHNEMAKMLNCKNYLIIFNNLKKAINFIKVYPDFKNKVNDIYEKIINA